MGGLQRVVLRLEFHQHRLSRFGDGGVEICPSPLTWPLAYTTVYTTVQAVITRRVLSINITRMWANAQRDGRPAKHRWRPLFNAAKFG